MNSFRPSGSMKNPSSGISPAKEAENYFKYLKTVGVDYVEPAPFEEKSEPGCREKFNELLKEVASCKNCELAKTRTQTVFGSGNPDAELMFVGEAPGAEEDRQGKPFVGRAGKLLTKMINAIDFSRDDVFIANVLKCRPPQNRDPKPEEVALCEGFLIRQIELIRPLFICALGLHAVKTLLRTKLSISKLRGSFHDYHGVPLLVTYHPAALLRNPGWKKAAWEDLKFLRDEHKKAR